MVQVHHADEPTNALSISGSWEFPNGSCALGIDAHTGWQNQVSQESNLLRGKDTLLLF